MARRGRKPGQTPLKIAKGTRAGRVNRRAPAAAPGVPACPKHLGRDARAEWRRMAPILAGMKVLSPSFGTALAIYCDAYGTWVEARAHIAKNGLTTATEKGGDKMSPHARVVHESYSTMLRVLAEFGCTPSSLGSIKTAGNEGDADDLAAFLKGGC